MKKIVFIILLALAFSVTFAQNDGKSASGGNSGEKKIEKEQPPKSDAAQTGAQSADTTATPKSKPIPIYKGWFFVPGAYWTFQDGTVGFLYVQGEFPKFGWTFDGRYAKSGDYWLDVDLRAKLLGYGNNLNLKYTCDSLEHDYRKVRFKDNDTLVAPTYTLTEYALYYRQHFNAGKINRFSLYAGYNHGEYVSDYVLDILDTGTTETRKMDCIDAGLDFSYDTRNDAENPKSSFFFGIRLGALYFANANDSDFDYLDPGQVTTANDKWPPKTTGYIELDQRLYGKLSTKSVPFPLILALRIGLGHHLSEVPQMMAFRMGEDNFMRGVEQRRIMGTSYYLMSGELRAQVWEESYTPLILLHWLIPGYENPRPILEIVPIIEASKIYGDYVRGDSQSKQFEQQTTYGIGLHWVFTDFTVMRFDVNYWGKGKTWGAYFSFEPSI